MSNNQWLATICKLWNQAEEETFLVVQVEESLSIKFKIKRMRNQKWTGIKCRLMEIFMMRLVIWLVWEHDKGLKETLDQMLLVNLSFSLMKFTDWLISQCHNKITITPNNNNNHNNNQMKLTTNHNKKRHKSLNN